jgi:hypothetical protein
MGRELLAVLIITAACNSSGAVEKSEAAAPAKSEHRPAPGATPFRVEVAPPASCVASASCEARIELTALGDYKVNDEYPFKFVADPDLGVAVDGSGSFEVTGKQTGTMTVTLRPAAAGPARVTGVFKLSVCTPENCEIEEPRVAIDLRVSPRP